MTTLKPGDEHWEHSQYSSRGGSVTFRPGRLALATAVAAALAFSGVAISTAYADDAEQIQNGTFDNGTAPWWWTGNLAPAVTDGQFCTTVPGGTTNPWDAIIGQNDLTLQNGVSYALPFTATASKA